MTPPATSLSPDLDRPDLDRPDLDGSDLDGDVADLDELSPLYLGPSPTWAEQAACVGRTDLFFGIAGERPERRVKRERIARALCNACPVMAECRTAARTNRENGFWGGETEEERAAAGFPPRSISRRSVLAARRTAIAS